MTADNEAPLSRAQRKAELETRIEQERVDILVAANRWHTAAESIDSGWHALMRFKVPLYAIGGVLMLGIGKNHSRLIRYGRRATASALLINRLRRLLS